jgi:hypothetical protein
MNGRRDPDDVTHRRGGGAREAERKHDDAP